MNAPFHAPPIDTLVRQVLGEAAERRLTLATAESCTGGLISSLLTDVTGYSHAFERGFVTYTDEAKGEVLGVPMTLIQDKGAVSGEVAQAMAEGTLEHSRADVAVAVTGFADGAANNEPGLVFIAAARRGRPTRVQRFEFGEIGRDRVRSEATRAALELFRLQIV